MKDLQLVLLVVLAIVCNGVAQKNRQVRSFYPWGAIPSLNPLSEDFPAAHAELLRAENALKQLWTPRGKAPAELEEEQVQVSDECDEAIANLANTEALSKLVPLLDATGKPGPGVAEGNFIMDGSYGECFSVNYTGFCITGVLLAAFPELGWKLEICTPKECSSSTDIAVLINNTGVLLTDEENVHCTTSESTSYGWGAIVMIVISTIFVATVLASTVADIIFEQFIPFFFGSIKKESHVPIVVSSNAPNLTDSTKNSETITMESCKQPPHASQEKLPLIVPSQASSKDKVAVWDFVKAFSLFKTIPSLLATDQPPHVITSMNGIRVISMFWIILGHTHLWAFMPGGIGVDNMLVYEQVSSRFTFQSVNNGYVGVDSFFLLSGVLVAYLTLREMKKKKRFPLLHYYVHRYLRLTPTYAFVLFFSWALASHLTNSPIVVIFGPQFFRTCKQYWWSNLLYINNFYPWKQEEECFGWAWYLANDMQFYIIAPLILVPAFYFIKAALVFVAILLFCSFTVTAVLVGVYDLQVNKFAEVAYGYNGTATTSDYDALIYVKPWSRIPPYLVGLILGYLFYKEYRLPFSKRKNAVLSFILLVLAGIAGIFQLYGLYFSWHGHTPTRFENVLYATVNYFLWGMVLATLIFVCHNGYGWIINSFLSMKMWIPLSRMTFNAYLVHPVVLTVIFGQLQKSIHYTDITMAFYVVGIVVLSFGVAGVVCVFVEFPLGTVEMLVFRLLGMKGRPSQRQVALTMGDQQKQEQTQV